jgi:uncharacterized protein (DUF1501 family)
MENEKKPVKSLSRRRILRSGVSAATTAALAGFGGPGVFGQMGCAFAADGSQNNRILVVLEMSGGNDGLNTVVPYGDDTYYRHRPKIGIKPDDVLKIDDHFGFNPGCVGFERLYKEGKLAILHGCGYDNPSFSHFTSMAYLHTAAPNSGEEYGWMGRLADAIDPGNTPNFMINIDATQSLAVRSRDHVPVVFDDPAKFARQGFFQQQSLFHHVADAPKDGNSSRRFLSEIAHSALDASALVRDAWAAYDTPVDYGLTALDLDKIASLIHAGLPTRLYYTSFRNNSFDTHVHQSSLHRRLLTYVADAVAGFMADMERIGRADDVVVLIMSEFGRRVPENTSLGTDHGAANNMYIVGKPVKGGHYGEIPSLTALDDGDNLLHTSDFRRAYATVTENWLGHQGTKELLGGDFAPFPVFG